MRYRERKSNYARKIEKIDRGENQINQEKKRQIDRQRHREKKQRQKERERERKREKERE